MKWTVAAAVLSLDPALCRRDMADASLGKVDRRREMNKRLNKRQSDDSQRLPDDGRRPFAGFHPRRSRIDQHSTTEHHLEAAHLRPNKTKRPRPQQLIECDPFLQPEGAAPDVGILDCGVGAYCMESSDSVLGGYCAAQEDTYDNVRHPKGFFFGHLNSNQAVPRAECDPLQHASSCDPGHDCVEFAYSAMGGICVDNSAHRHNNPFSGFQRQLQYYSYTMFFDFIEYACANESLMCGCTTDAATGATVMSCSYIPPCVIDYAAPCLEESKVVDVCNSLRIDAVGTGPTDFEFNFCYGYSSPFTTEYCYQVVSDSGLLTCTMTMDEEQCVSCDLDPENICIQFDCTNTAFGTAGNLCEDRPLPDLAFVELLDCYGACNICGEGGKISNYGYDVSPQVDFSLDCYFTPICAQDQLMCEEVQTIALLGGLIGSNSCKISPDVDIYTTCCIETSSPVASPTPQQGTGCESYNFDCFSCIENDCYWCPGEALCSDTTSFDDELNVFEDREHACKTPEDYTTDTCTEPGSFFSDPLYSAQEWIFDMINIRPVWEKGYRGNGIHVRINDEGIEPDHPEFEGRIDNDASCFGQIRPSSSAYLSGFSHGTAVASIVGAGADNDVCGVGIAPEVGLSSCFFNRQATFAELLIYELQAVDISQNSWGRPSCFEKETLRKLQQSQCPFTYSESYVFPCLYCDFNNLERGTCIEAITLHCQFFFREDRIACLEHLELTLDGNCNFQTISEETERALETGISEGRDGKGVIYVFASGNDLFNGADTNFEGIGTNTRFAISVGAVGKDKRSTFYSTGGASQFVTAPGGDITSGVTNFVTANLDGGCTDAGQGTSFSAPVVAGVVALMLEANPELTWRDVQSIIATTSQPVDNDDLDHTNVVNGANIWHSNFYGFGIIDASAAVEAAESWELVGPERSVTQSSPTLNLPIPDDQTQPITSSMELNVLNQLTIESVYVYLKLEHSSRGHLQVKLTSPSGTDSIMSPGRRPENTQHSGTGWWQLMSVAFWGEAPNGQWTLSLADLKDGDVSAEGSCASYEWLYTDKISCSILERIEYCANGQVDPYNYAQAYGVYSSIFSFEYNGFTAEEACCACGGGVDDIDSLSDSLIEWKVTIFGEGSSQDEPTTPLPTPAVSTPQPTNSPMAVFQEVEPTQPPLPILIPSPTSSPDPVQILTFNATGDTYFYRKSVNPLTTSQPSPLEQTMLVENGQDFRPDAFALLSFPDKDLTDSSFGIVSSDPISKVAIQTNLCLDHVVKAESMNASTYTICRLTGKSVTTANGGSIDLEDTENENDKLSGLRIPEDCMGSDADLVEFEVFPADTTICIDVTRLMKISSSPPEKRQTNPIIFENEEKDLMFIIENLGPEQVVGDKFFTMNSDKPPQLVFEQVDVDSNIPTNGPTPPPIQVVTETPSAPQPTNNSTTQPTALGDGADDSQFNKNYLYGLLGLLVLCPLFIVCFHRAKSPRIKNEDKQQTSSLDTTPSSGGGGIPPSDPAFEPTTSVQLLAQSIDGSHLQDTSVRYVDEDDDSVLSSESDGVLESEDEGDDSSESSSESSRAGETNDTFDDEAFSDDDDDILLRT